MKYTLAIETHGNSEMYWYKNGQNPPVQERAEVSGDEERCLSTALCMTVRVGLLYGQNDCKEYSLTNSRMYGSRPHGPQK